jgi:hypothetical protein
MVGMSIAISRETRRLQIVDSPVVNDSSEERCAMFQMPRGVQPSPQLSKTTVAAIAG